MKTLILLLIPFLFGCQPPIDSFPDAAPVAVETPEPAPMPPVVDDPPPLPLPEEPPAEQSQPVVAPQQSCPSGNCPSPSYQYQPRGRIFWRR